MNWYRSNVIKRTINSKYLIGVIAFLVGLITIIPYLGDSMTGHMDDMLFHMQRIEAVKDALISGKYPIYFNERFNNGLGYGVSLFYPDFFLIFPALLRILGISMKLSWTIFVFIIAFAGTLGTYFSIKYIVHRTDLAVLGASILILSPFFIADIIDRSGINEYIAIMFLSVLIAAIYDFFERDGNKSWLFVIAFSGIVLNHVITTFNALVITCLFFMGMLFTRKGRKAIFSKKILKLLYAGFLTILITAFFTFPMIEQMFFSDNTFKYSTPWAYIGNYTQQISSYFKPIGGFNYVAEVGLGIPLFLLVGIRIDSKRLRETIGEVFLIAGFVVMIAMTKVFPWSLFNSTIVNSIQFTYRLYPFALCFLTVGFMIMLAERDEDSEWVVLILLALTFINGLWESTYLYKNAMKVEVSDCIINETTDHLGQGEYLPVEYDLNNPQGIPYYKGFVAIDTENNKKLEVIKDKSDGSVSVKTDDSGNLKIYYEGTLMQRFSKWLSIMSVLTGGVYLILKHISRRNVRGCRNDESRNI